MTDLSKFQAEFTGFQNELRSFIYRLVANKQDMEDLAQDTYVKAFKHIDSFQGKSSFKTWVFAIASNLSKDFLKGQKRWKEDYQDQCRTATYASKEIQQDMGNIAMNSAHGKFVLKEHVDYCFTCMAKTLLLEEQVCVILKEIYGFKVQEIMEITALTEGKVKYALTNGRSRFIRIFEGRCALINKGGVCHQCSELNGMFNPQQDFEQEALKLKMVKEKDKANHDQLLDLRFQLVKNIDPVEAEGFELHNYMIEGVPKHAK